MLTQGNIAKEKLDKLFQSDEGINLEYKIQTEKRRDIAECLTAMANSKGGYIIFGVEDPLGGAVPPKIVGITNNKKLIDRIHGAAKDCTPPLNAYTYVELVKYKQKTIIVVEVYDKIPTVTNIGGKFLKRRGSHNMVMSFEDFIQRAVAHGAIVFENMAVPRAKWADLDKSKIKKYLEVRKEKSERSLNMTIKEFIVTLNCVIEEEGQLVPNYAGLLLFGRNPQKYLPQAEMTCIRFRGTEVTRGYIDRKDVIGTIPDMIDQGVEFVYKNMRTGGYVWGVKRTDYYEYPVKAIREAIANCCAHREYAQNGCICIYMFDDRIEFSSPGSIPFGISLEQIQRFEHRSRPRNPLIAHILRDMGYVERAGTGLKLMATEMEKNKLKKPIFKELEEELRTYFYGPSEKFMQEVVENELEEKENSVANDSLTNRQIKSLDYIRKYGRITNKEYRELFQISQSTSTRELNELCKQEILTKKGKGRATFYKML
ncbi:ATP-binding protein [Candidatus Uabimicrobium amorphum]|uniref:Transcriptional regulator n=1 Tax=Uabimicrobium amorphum TaxID=2596890 RepID=A0A5S9ITJ7_UABAM|nr:ATP-binding protein [Candidatus Uabimicrobium amorphum]BBM87291.1 transcriptional regulator [Candidatus Uabimicrobium amorphum]